MKRDIQPVLAGLLSAPGHRDVVLVEGARQVGKSTLVKQVLAEVECPKVAIDLKKDRKIARLIDKTADFEDFRFLLRDQLGAGRNSALCCAQHKASFRPIPCLASFLCS
jgi:hypothetical protein